MNIGSELGCWKALKSKFDLSSHKEVAKVLLDKLMILIYFLISSFFRFKVNVKCVTRPQISLKTVIWIHDFVKIMNTIGENNSCIKFYYLTLGLVKMMLTPWKGEFKKKNIRNYVHKYLAKSEGYKSTQKGIFDSYIYLQHIYQIHFYVQLAPPPPFLGVTFDLDI